MTPDELRAITDPAARERVARAAVEVSRQEMAEYAAVRAEAVRQLYEQDGSWRSVGESLDPPVSAQAVFDIAHPRKR